MRLTASSSQSARAGRLTAAALPRQRSRYLCRRGRAAVWTLVHARASEAAVELIASDLTRMECRVKPIRDRDADLLRDFDQFFETIVSALVPLTREVIDLATEIRAESGLRTPDAIHLAAARSAACDSFLTND